MPSSTFKPRSKRRDGQAGREPIPRRSRIPLNFGSKIAYRPKSLAVSRRKGIACEKPALGAAEALPRRSPAIRTDECWPLDLILGSRGAPPVSKSDYGLPVG